MEHLQFDSTYSMRRHLIDSRRLNLAPPQHALAPGDYFVYFPAMTRKASEVRWGRVMTEPDLREYYRTGDEPVVQAILATIKDRRHDLGEVRCYEWIRERTLPVAVVRGAIDLWPVEARLFSAAQAVDFKVEALPDWGRLLLDVAYRSLYAHRLTAS